ncbi:hypothetical protein K402DRAFT_453106 [Aulographum hederae CBS 113979]|uniref:Zn(2)-C6 fungal-type domain-containing protein n=1 Tax=Aulographum hederae CBS 113979 TaxID=1176131 RepID=A0A6G1H405_9PEZI|nr:hypothetical protein K402DRAFT_453106 [Aulographum hederae CBS 113979]
MDEDTYDNELSSPERTNTLDSFDMRYSGFDFSGFEFADSGGFGFFDHGLGHPALTARGMWPSQDPFTSHGEQQSSRIASMFVGEDHGLKSLNFSLLSDNYGADLGISDATTSNPSFSSRGFAVDTAVFADGLDQSLLESLHMDRVAEGHSLGLSMFPPLSYDMMDHVLPDVLNGYELLPSNSDIMQDPEISTISTDCPRTDAFNSESSALVPYVSSDQSSPATAGPSKGSHLGNPVPSGKQLVVRPKKARAQPYSKQSQTLPGYSSFMLEGSSFETRKPARFSPDQRRKVGQVRRLGACLRCRWLKRKCSVGQPCLACVRLQNAAVNHETKCLRWVGCIRSSFSEVNPFLTGPWKADDNPLPFKPAARLVGIIWKNLCERVLIFRDTMNTVERLMNEPSLTTKLLTFGNWDIFRDENQWKFEAFQKITLMCLLRYFDFLGDWKVRRACEVWAVVQACLSNWSETSRPEQLLRRVLYSTSSYLFQLCDQPVSPKKLLSLYEVDLVGIQVLLNSIEDGIEIGLQRFSTGKRGNDFRLHTLGYRELRAAHDDIIQQRLLSASSKKVQNNCL